MAPKELYHRDFCKIYFHTESKIINIQWQGFPRSQEFREACYKVIDFMIEYKTGKLLTDNRNAKVFSVEDQKWLNTEWLPQAIKAGYYCSATLINDDVFVKTAIQNITKKRDSEFLKTKIFNREEEALSWLLSV